MIESEFYKDTYIFVYLGIPKNFWTVSCEVFLTSVLVKDST